ncbi:hypothetical protein [Chryseobacterium oranimense]|uniref:hypothetical protein n=1 Tax=Chryseobacterium oranimense TaxID=421058 RepID=UPI000595C886|nr:hypothetical protein [Chryseobacterium oranimense]
MNPFSDLIKKPTFLSIVSIILFVLGIPLIIYQLLTMGPGGGLGITVEIIFLLIMFGLLVVDRSLVKKIDLVKLSVIEVILITAYLIYYYYTNNHSFSIG